MKAWEFLQDNGWCQGQNAKNSKGERVGIHQPEAAAWCAIGAIYKAYGDDTESIFTSTQNLGRLVGCMVSDWNDQPERTKEEVIKAMKQVDV